MDGSREGTHSREPAAASPIAQAFHVAPSALIVFDARRELVGCNRAAQLLLGLGEGVSHGDLSAMLSDSSRLDAANGRALAAAVRRLTEGEGGEESVACAQGRVLRLRSTAVESGWTIHLHPALSQVHRGSDRREVDELTGVLSRATFRECLSDAEIEMRMQGRGAALLFLDLDRFKHVNDTFGHPVGDVLLARVAERMRKAVRAEDAVGRLGGDEFAILTEVADEAAVEKLSARLIHLVNRPYLIDGHLVTIGISIGWASMPEDAETADQLTRCADLALYRAKADGRGLLRRYRPEMAEQAAARRLLEFDLRKAQLMGEFELHYQPQIAAGGDQVMGFEALLRWNHPIRGRVSPADFVPLAEETGQIVAIGEWVLRTAVADALGWPEDVSVAVNVSPMQFRTGKLVATVAAVLAETGIAPHRLELEITEGVLLNDERANLATLTELQRLGVRIAIDDFGTGYASLAYLKRFAFDKIKIDQSFVREITRNADSDAIVRAVVDLGRMLGMSTIAEGVETEEELERVRAHGCGAVQGYLTGRPMPLAEVRRLIAARSPETDRA